MILLIYRGTTAGKMIENSQKKKRVTSNRRKNKIPP